MTRHAHRSISLILGAAACVPASSTTPTPTTEIALDSFGSFAARAQCCGRVGRLPTNLDVAKLDRPDLDHDTYATTTSPMADFALYFEKLDAGRICFTHYDNGMKTYEDANELGQAILKHHALAVEAIEAIGAIQTRALWPSTGPTLDSVEVVHDAVRDKDTDSGTVVRQRGITWRLCGKAPALGPSTTYLAVVIHGDKPTYVHQDDSPMPPGQEGTNGLLLWELADGPRQHGALRPE
jgi:hypothetical protein